MPFQTMTVPRPSPEVDAAVRKALTTSGLLALRTKAGLSQDAIAQRCGVSRGAVCRWEAKTRFPTGAAASILHAVLTEIRWQAEE